MAAEDRERDCGADQAVSGTDPAATSGPAVESTMPTPATADDAVAGETASTVATDPRTEPRTAPRISVRDAVARLLACPDLDSLLSTALDVALAAVGADAGVVYVAEDDGWIRLAEYTGTKMEMMERVPALAPDSPLALATALRERRPVRGLAENLYKRFPDLDFLNAPIDYIVVPMLIDDRALGALGVRYARTDPLSADEEQSLRTLADVCALRLEHLQLPEPFGTPAPTAPVRSSKPGTNPIEFWQSRRNRQSRRTRLELAMSSGNIGAFEWDITSGTVVWDERTIKLFGLESESFDSRIETFFEAVHPDDRDFMREAIERSLVAGEQHTVNRVVWQDGSVHWVEARGTVEYSPDGEPLVMIGVVWDVTDQRVRTIRREARREFVLKVTNAFTAALSTQDVLDTMTGTVLPELGATAMAIHIEREGRLVLAGAVGYPDETMARLRLIGTEEDNPMAEVLREGQPLFFGSRAEYLKCFPDPGVRPSENHHAFVFLPLASADGAVGTCLISYREPREFSSDDQIITAAISGILAQSLARARLSDLFRRRMTDLQDLMMPRALPRLPGFEIAARYLPSAEGMQVGGDWFDMLPREDGGASFVIGDVQGHSAQAAGVMGQLRTALRAHAADGYRAQHLMARGNQTLWGLDTDRFATCCIVDVSPRAGHLEIVRAGHPNPLQAEPDGTVHELAVPGALPLGYSANDRYPVFHGQLQPGAALLLFTDGLVDRPDRPYDEAVAAVATVFGQWVKMLGADGTYGKADLEALADTLVSDTFTHPGYDDVAVLLLRRTPMPS
ncbi:SpoIIE family protein phosphatase [Streptomyces sp. NPDC004838]